jgi:hypothetical protein
MHAVVRCEVGSSALRRILSYDCSCDVSSDCALNYALTALTALLLVITAPRLLYSSLLVVSFAAFQLVLCLFVVACVGVSIVWNAALGASVVFALRTPERVRRALHVEFAVFVATVGALVDVYYALSADALTTVAHIAALVLGVLVAQIMSSSFAALVVTKVRDRSRNRTKRSRRKSKRNVQAQSEETATTNMTSTAALQNGK